MHQHPQTHTHTYTHTHTHNNFMPFSWTFTSLSWSHKVTAVDTLNNGIQPFRLADHVRFCYATPSNVPTVITHISVSSLRHVNLTISVDRRRRPPLSRLRTGIQGICRTSGPVVGE